MTNFFPPGFGYTIRLVHKIIVLTTITELDFTVTINGIDELELNESRKDRIRLAARYFTLEHGVCAHERGELIRDTRPFKDHMVLRDNVSSFFTMELNTDGLPEEFLLELDFVKEDNFWFSDIGYKSLQIPVLKRAVIFGPS